MSSSDLPYSINPQPKLLQNKTIDNPQPQKQSKMKTQSCRLLDLPQSILNDILSRLPPIEIIRGRCTCKTLNNSISDPEFINLQFSRTPTYFLINNLSSSPADSSYFSLIEFEDDPNHRHHLQRVAGIKLELPKTKSDSEMNIVGIINGFVCICEKSLPRHVVHIWNPITGEFIRFEAPEIAESSNRIVASYGFGLSSKKGEYKVVRVCQERIIEDGLVKAKSECHVYTLGTGSWRRIGIENIQWFCKGHATFVEGNLHWLFEVGPNLLYCFDLENETMEPFPSPPLNVEYPKATLNLYNGFLCVCDNTQEFDAQVWVMKEYGVTESWTKMCEISEGPLGSLGNYFDTVHFVRVFDDGEILILLGNNTMFFRHPDGSTWDVDTRELVRSCVERIGFMEEQYFAECEALQFDPSFMSFKNLGEEVLRMM